MKVIVSFLLSSLMLSDFAIAQACDPEKILRTDVENYYNNDVVFLSDIQSRTFSKDQKRDTSIGVTYKGIPMSFSDARSMSEFVTENSNFQLSREQTTSVMRATLSDASVEAYIQCLQANQGVVIVVPPSALNEEQFPFKVEWRPANPVEPSKISLSVTGGELVNANVADLMKANEEREFTIKRDTTKTLFISVTVNGEVDTISLPRKPAFRVKISELFDPPMDQKEAQIVRGDGAHTTDKRFRDLCVTSTDGGLFSSDGAAKIIASDVIDGQKRVKIEMDVASNNSRRVCGRITASSGAKEIMVRIRARLQVFKASVEPM
jgi:hypothetical protein